MKKLIALFLVLAICLTLGACGAKEEEKKTDSSKTEQTLSDLELGKKLLKEGKDNEAYAAFKKSDDPEAEIYLKCFYKWENKVEEIWYKSDGTVSSKAENGIWTYLSSDIGSFEFEVGQDKYGNKVYTSKKIEGNFTALDIIEYGIYPVGEILREYEYDDKGNVIRETSALPSDQYTTYVYTYDKDGNVINKVEKLFDSGELVREEVTTYDKNGNVIFSKDPRGECEYTYDSQNNKTLCLEYDYNGKFVGKEEYEYDSNNNNTLLLEYDSNGKLESKTECSYNKDNKLVSSKTYDGNGVLTKRCENTYDSKSNLISSAWYEANDIVTSITKYDKYGRKVYEAGGYTEDKKLVIKEYTFDSKGNLILEYKHTEDGEPLEKIEQRYDENSERTYWASETFTGENAGKYVTEHENGVVRRRATYNLEGALESEILYDKHGHRIYDYDPDAPKFDEFGMPIKQGPKYEYQYDENENLILAEGWDPQTNILRLKYEYEYDEQGNCIYEKTCHYEDGEEITSAYRYKFDNDGNKIYVAKYEQDILISETKYSYSAYYIY